MNTSTVLQALTRFHRNLHQNKTYFRFFLAFYHLKRFIVGEKKYMILKGPELQIRGFYGTVHFCRFGKIPKKGYAHYLAYSSEEFRPWQEKTLYVPTNRPTIVYVKGRFLYGNVFSTPCPTPESSPSFVPVYQQEQQVERQVA